MAKELTVTEHGQWAWLGKTPGFREWLDGARERQQGGAGVVPVTAVRVWQDGDGSWSAETTLDGYELGSMRITGQLSRVGLEAALTAQFNELMRAKQAALAAAVSAGPAAPAATMAAMTTPPDDQPPKETTPPPDTKPKEKTPEPEKKAPYSPDE